MSNGKSEWVDWRNTKVLQKAVVIDEDGNMLVLKRIETGPASRLGKWDLPGGSIESSDVVSNTKPHIEAMRREISDETGLLYKDIMPVFVDSWVFKRSVGSILGIAIGYKATVDGVKPLVSISDEHIESQWGRREILLALDYGEDGGLYP